MIKGAGPAACLKGALRPSSAPLFTWFTNPSGFHTHDPQKIRPAISSSYKKKKNRKKKRKTTSLKCSICSLTSIDLFPSPLTVSGFQDSGVIRIWHGWYCWTQHGRLYPSEKRGIIRCSIFRTNQKESP